MLQTAFLTVAGHSLQAAVVILVVILMRLLLRKMGAPAVASYALWAVVLFRLLCPVSLESPVGVIPEEMAHVPAQHAVVDYQYVPADTAILAPYLSLGDAMGGSIDGVDFTYESETAGPNQDGSGRIFPEEALLLTMGVLWPVGMVALVIYSIAAYFRLRRRLVGAVPLEGNIRLADHIGSPFVLGLFRPRIYLPSDLTEGEREYIILHEKTHIRRLDHVVKILAFAALCIHWFNPLVWLAFSLSGQDMEMSCDEAVVRKLGGGIRADYSASLLKLSTGRAVIAATPLAFGEGNTKGRIKNLAGWKKPAVYITAIAVALCAVVILLFATNRGGNNLKIRHSQKGVEVTCRFDGEVDDWAVYEDVYQDGALLSSHTVLVNGEHPKRADLSKKFDYIFKTNTVSADGGGFSGKMTVTITDENGTETQRSLNLPREVYGALMVCAGDHDAFPMNGKLGANDQAVLFSIVLSLDEGTVVDVEDGVVKHNDTVVQYRLVTADYVCDWPEKIDGDLYLDFESERPPRNYGPDMLFVPERCVYMNPLLSYYPVGGDSGYLYRMGDHGVHQVSRSTGDVTALSEQADWERWEEFPWSNRAWKALFFGDKLWTVDISDYDQRLYCPLSETHCLLRMDGALWLVQFMQGDSGERHVLTIYELVLQNNKGAAQWEFNPILSSRLPYFCFEFDVGGGELSVSCIGGKLSEPDGQSVKWYPMDKDGMIATEGAVYFIINQDETIACSGTVYIQGHRVEENGNWIYTAKVVGTGLVMEQNPDGGAIIRIK